MPFSFEYDIDPEGHKTEEDIKAIAVECPSGQKLLPDTKDWLDQTCRTEE